MYDLKVSVPSDVGYPVKSYNNFTVTSQIVLGQERKIVTYTSNQVKGEYPILVNKVSQCCREYNGHIRSKKVIIPPTR